MSKRTYGIYFISRKAYFKIILIYNNNHTYAIIWKSSTIPEVHNTTNYRSNQFNLLWLIKINIFLYFFDVFFLFDGRLHSSRTLNGVQVYNKQEKMFLKDIMM